MNLDSELSLLTCYRLRKLLHQYGSELKSIVAQGAGVCANYQSNLNQVLESLYLEQTEISAKVQQLEALTRQHRILVTRSSSYSQELPEIEQQIFWILGLKLVT